MENVLATSIFVLFLFALAEANNCSTIACEDGMCCQSTQNKEECCSADSKCDTILGCVSTNETDSKPSLKKCPFGTKMCWTIIIIDFCCPYPMGVCCPDLSHCCPHGYECDIWNQRCNKKNTYRYKRDLSNMDKSALRQCSGKVWCPREDECCLDKNGEFSCCRSFAKPLISKAFA